MTTPSTIRRAPGLAEPILSRVAWRIAMAAADRVKVGRLHVVLPGRQPADVRGRRPPNRSPRSTSTTVAR